MKHLKILSLFILSAVLLIACSGNNRKGTTENNDTSSSSSANSSVGDAHFSCVVDGQPISGGLLDGLIQSYEGYHSNEAHIVDVSQGKELLFYLSDAKSTSSQAAHWLRFAVPDKTGSSSFGPDEDGWGIEVNILINKDHTARYTSDSFTINITSLATRVSGTFSGKFSLNGNITDTGKKEIEVTDGKFDIPMRQ